MKNNVTASYYLLKRKAVYVLMMQGFVVQQLHAQTIKADTVKKLKEVNVNSTTTPKPQTVAPSQQITSSDFGRYGALSVADALANFAGVNLKDYGGIGGLKTVSVRSLGANNTGVLYDGIQMNDAQSGQIDLGKFGLTNIESVALYNGQSPRIVQPAQSFASASIIDIVTTQPKLTAAKPYQITAGMNGGSFGLANPFMQWQQRVSRQWSFILNGNYTYANGRYKYRTTGDGSDTVATRTNSDVRAIQTDGALYWAKNDSNKFKVQFNYYNGDRGLPGAVIFYTTNSIQRLQNHDLLVQSAYEHIADNSFHLLINTKFSQNYTHFTDPDFLNNAGGLNEHYTQHEFYQSASVGYHLLSGWEVAYNSDVSFTNLKSDAYNYAFPTRLTLLNVLASDAAFGKCHFQGNILHTYITENVQSGTASPDRSVFSPTIMASFQPLETKSFLIRAFYKNIFRDPTFAELYFFNVVGPRNLKPEYSKQYDLGLTWQKSFDGLLHDIALTTDAYYNTITNKIIFLGDPNRPSFTNLGSVEIKGLDVTVKTNWLFSKYWAGALSASYTYQDAIDVTNPTDSYYLDQIPYTPKNLLNLNAGIDHRGVGLYYNYTLSSSRYYVSNNDPQYYLPGYNISNVSLLYNSVISHYPFRASVQVNNLSDLNYVIVRSFPMPGRSFRLSIQITI